LKVAATAARERLDGAAIARALDEHYSAQLHTRIRSADEGESLRSLESKRWF
jgi:hypothetical protein